MGDGKIFPFRFFFLGGWLDIFSYFFYSFWGGGHRFKQKKFGGGG